MTSASSPGKSGHRRGRYALAAVAAALTLTGVVIAGVAASGPPEPAAPGAATGPAATGRAAGAGSAPGPSTGPAQLTRGPLMAASPPVRVSIPALRVTSSLIGLGLRDDMTMQVPDDAETVGWFTRAPPPGALGPAVLAGHVDWKGKPGAFVDLVKLRPGDVVAVDRQDGSTATFTVTKVAQYPKDRFPTEMVYGAIDHAGLRLITCGGQFDAARSSYRDNVIVFAALTSADPA